jgi:tetratricopeptide (TPR) repeat protein
MSIIVHPEGGNVTDQPRIFVSAVSCEFNAAREQVAEVLRRLGCEPVWQAISGSESEDLRPRLRETIRSCNGLIQMVGDAYGPEPAVRDEKFGRVSYAQFEYLFARQKGKKTWLIFVENAETSRFAENPFDKPADPSHPDPEGYQLERQILQEEYRERLQTGGQPYLEATNEIEIRNRLESKKGEFDRLRRVPVSHRLRGKRVAAVLAMLLAAIAISGGAWAAIRVYHNRLLASAVASLDPELIRSRLERSIRAACERETAEANKSAEPKARQKALLEAEKSRDRELAQLEPTVAFIRGTIVRGEASSAFLEMSHLLQEQGVDSALAFLASQESSLLINEDRWKTMPPHELRRMLAPLLGETVLLRQRGDLPASGRICERLLIGDSDWPDARFHFAITMMALGERSLVDERPTAAWQRFVMARSCADRLVQTKQLDPLWVPSLSRMYLRLGRLSEEAGRQDESRLLYTNQLECAKIWAASEPQSVTAQSELSRAFVKVGELNVRRGQFKVAEEFHAQGLEIADKLSDRDPTNTQAKQELSKVYIGIGDLWAQLGMFKVAQRHFDQSLTIQKQLAAANPGDRRLRQELAASYERSASAKKEAARDLYQNALDLRAKLAAELPKDASSQSELAAAYERLAQVSPADISADLYAKSLPIRKALAEADRANSKAQIELSATFKKGAAASVQNGRLDLARSLCEQNLDYLKKLSASDPANLAIQLRLSAQYDDLGALCQQSGQFDVAKDFYQKALDACIRVANTNPGDDGGIRDLCRSYVHMALLHEAVGNVQAAVQTCEQGIAEYQRLGTTPLLQAQMHRHLVMLELQYAYCMESEMIMGALDPVLKERPERVPILLRRRCRLLAAHKDVEGVARTAGALQNLEPKSSTNLYFAACGYGLCAKLEAGWPGAGPFQTAEAVADKNSAKLPQKPVDERNYRQTAFDLLQQAANAGYSQMRRAPLDPDLAALHALPEFKTLVSRSPKGRRLYGGG